MKKRLFRFFTLMLMMFMMFTTTTFASENVLVSMTSVEFLAKSNDEGIITLTEDIVLSDSLKMDKNYTVDLNGHTLKFTVANNYFVNGDNVTFKNGTINLDGIKGSGDCILGVGNYGSSAKLTLDNVNVQANNYTSPYALIYVYNDSTLNIENNSSVNAKNEKSLSGGVIKTSKGQAGKVNITNSTLNFENTARGFVDGTINVKNSEVSMKGLANGINSSNAGLNITVDNSDVTITGSIGNALKINNSQVNVVNDSKLDLSKSLAGDIQFASKGTVSVDKSSELNVDKIKLDDSIKGTGLDELIVSEGYTYIVDDKGNVTKVCKHVNTEIVNVEAATCSKEGYTGDKICSDCGEVLEKGNVIPKLEHKVEVKGKKEATCKEEGYTGDKVCSDCGEILEKGNTIAKLSHKFENGTCTHCNETQKGWVLENGKWYYYKDNGVKATGWLKLGTKWYYLNSKGEMQVGWIKLGAKWYYLNSNGEMATGWVKLADKWYYLRSNGEMATGWEKVDNKWYYLNSNGEMQVGWIKLGAKWYYLNSNGEMATGWEKVDNKWYYLNSNGEMQIGWIKLGAKWYYLNSNGEMAIGWKKVDNKWYYLNSNGEMQTGWVKLADKWYYLRNNGEMATGWEKVNGTWYYMYSSGVMATNTVIDGWKINASGAATPIR